MWDISIRSAQALISFPAKMVGVTQAAFTDQARDPEGPVGVVGVSRISGEVAAADAPPSWRIAQFLAIVASLNLFLFLFNLLPILPLDGGHVAGALFEGARRQVAKWRGQPDPGPVDVARMLPVAYTVAIILIGVSVIILWADIVKPIRLG
jgi:membrane-associated protease RseP (regulator of RpoE activity)